MVGQCGSQGGLAPWVGERSRQEASGCENWGLHPPQAPCVLHTSRPQAPLPT